MCEPNVWLDGTLMSKARESSMLQDEDGDLVVDTDLQRSDAPLFSMDEYVDPQDVLGIEVYRRISTTPLQWVGPGTSCGSILIWTKGRAGSEGG